MNACVCSAWWLIVFLTQSQINYWILCRVVLPVPKFPIPLLTAWIFRVNVSGWWGCGFSSFTSPSMSENSVWLPWNGGGGARSCLPVWWICSKESWTCTLSLLHLLTERTPAFSICVHALVQPVEHLIVFTMSSYQCCSNCWCLTLNVVWFCCTIMFVNVLPRRHTAK